MPRSPKSTPAPAAPRPKSKGRGTFNPGLINPINARITDGALAALHAHNARTREGISATINRLCLSLDPACAPLTFTPPLP